MVVEKGEVEHLGWTTRRRPELRPAGAAYPLLHPDDFASPLILLRKQPRIFARNAFYDVLLPEPCAAQCALPHVCATRSGKTSVASA